MEIPMKLPRGILPLLIILGLWGCNSPCEKAAEAEAAGDLRQASLLFAECEGSEGAEGSLRVAMAQADADAPVGLERAARYYNAAQQYQGLAETSMTWALRHVGEIEKCQSLTDAKDWESFNESKVACTEVTSSFEGPVGSLAGSALLNLGDVEKRLMKDAGVGKPAKGMENYLRVRLGMDPQQAGKPSDVLWSDGKAHRVTSRLWKCGPDCYETPFVVQKDVSSGVLLGVQHVLKMEQEKVEAFLELATGGTGVPGAARWVVGTAVRDLRRTGSRQEKDYPGVALMVGRSGSAEWVTVTMR